MNVCVCASRRSGHAAAAARRHTDAINRNMLRWVAFTARLLSKGQGHAESEEPGLRVAPQVHAAHVGRAERADFGVVPRVVRDREQVDRAEVRTGGARPRDEPGRQFVAELYVLESDVAPVLDEGVGE